LLAGDQRLFVVRDVDTFPENPLAQVLAHSQSFVKTDWIRFCLG